MVVCGVLLPTPPHPAAAAAAHMPADIACCVGGGAGQCMASSAREGCRGGRGRELRSWLTLVCCRLDINPKPWRAAGWISTLNPGMLQAGHQP